MYDPDSSRPRLALSAWCCCCALLGGLGCDPGTAQDPAQAELRPLDEPLALVTTANWRPTAAALDPASAHRPEPLICPESAWQDEYGALELSTSECNYFSLSQPLAHPITAGDELALELWWQTLIAEDPAQAHLALYIGDDLLWETHLEIPQAADARREVFLSEITAPAGAPLTFHLHNHGYNDYTLGALELVGVVD